MANYIDTIARDILKSVSIEIVDKDKELNNEEIKHIFFDKYEIILTDKDINEIKNDQLTNNELYIELQNIIDSHEIKFVNISDFLFFTCKTNNNTIKDKYTENWLSIWRELS